MKDVTLEEVLEEALLDEYKARDTYRKIIDTFGAVRPFVNIVFKKYVNIKENR